MRPILINSTHRKFIRLLRHHTEKDSVIVLTEEDWNSYQTLVCGTMDSMKRHLGVYRITLRAINRKPTVDFKTSSSYILDRKSVDRIERALVYAERRYFLKTIRLSYFKPILQKISQKLERQR